MQNCVVRGVRDGVFGIAFGANWNAPDSVLRIDTDITPDEVQFQPGVYLMKAGPAREEILGRNGGPLPSPAPTPTVGHGGEIAGDGTAAPRFEPGAENAAQGIASIRLTIRNVPADKMRDVIKVVILTLAASGAGVRTNLEVVAEAGEGGIPRETLELTLMEGWRQLGIDTTVEIDGDKA